MKVKIFKFEIFSIIKNANLSSKSKIDGLRHFLDMSKTYLKHDKHISNFIYGSIHILNSSTPNKTKLNDIYINLIKLKTKK